MTHTFRAYIGRRREERKLNGEEVKKRKVGVKGKGREVG